MVFKYLGDLELFLPRIYYIVNPIWGLPRYLVVKNLPANGGDAGDLGSICGLGRSPGVGHGNPLQYSCLRNPMDRGVW